MIKVTDLSVSSGDFQLTGVNFEIPMGKYGVLMGRTGAGKTTLLEAICGLRPIISGQIFLNDQEVTSAAPNHRAVGLVPQDSALFSTMTVRKHLEFAPKLNKWAKPEIDSRVARLADELSIEKLLDRKPQGLSGGERQRVALGRALAARPGILCLDEPLSALDETTHGEMLELLIDIAKTREVTVLHITHSQSEAESVADLIINLNEIADNRTP